MSGHISRGTSSSTALVPQEQLDMLDFPEEVVFIRREKQEDFPEMKFNAGKAYSVYNQHGRLLHLYGGDHSHAFDGAAIDGYIPRWMH